MINALKALIVILPVLAGVFIIARFVFRNYVSPQRMDRWMVIFCVFTAVGFLIPNFWVMIIALGAMLSLIIVLRIEQNLAALFALLICVLPPFEQPIPGFGGINQLFPISPPLLFSIVILIPAMFHFKSMAGKLRGVLLTDVCMFSYVALSAVLAFRDTSFTDGLRIVWVLMLTVFLPYYVVSRWTKTVEDLQVFFLALITPLLGLAAVSFFESVLAWHFYGQPAQNWHGYDVAVYIYRLGFLRSFASIMGPIEFGFLLMVAMTLSYSLINKKIPKILAIGGLGTFAGSLLLTFSRGPWLGAVIATSTYVVSGPKGFSRGIVVGFFGVLVLGLLAISPFGEQIVSIIPIIGDTAGENETVSYRQRLFENGTKVIMQNPLFGSTNYLQTPEMRELVQGQGIIDLVNSYIQIGLAKGLVGLALFVGILFSGANAAFRASVRTVTTNPEFSGYCRAIFAALMGAIVVIATTSSISQVPTFYWMLSGLGVAVMRIAKGIAATSGGAQTSDKDAAASLEPKGTPEPALSMRAAKEHSELDAEARAHAKRNAEKKANVQKRNLPPHLRQYVQEDPNKK